MTSKKQTLAQYLQRQEVLRNPNRYQGLSETQRQRIEYFDAKKKKVGILLNDILYQVKKSIQPNDQNYSKIDKMVKSAVEQIKAQFDNTNNFTQEKPREEINQFDTQPDLSRISLHNKMIENESDKKVLKESNKASQVPIKQQADKQKGANGNNRAKENSKVGDVKSRTYLAEGR